MDGENRFGKHSFSGADHGFEHAFISILSGAFRELDDEWRAALDVASKQAEELFHVIDVVRADGEFAVGDFVELSSGDDHRLTMSILRAGTVTRQILIRKSRIGNLKLSVSVRAGGQHDAHQCAV